MSNEVFKTQYQGTFPCAAPPPNIIEDFMKRNTGRYSDKILTHTWEIQYDRTSSKCSKCGLRVEIWEIPRKDMKYVEILTLSLNNKVYKSFNAGCDEIIMERAIG